MYGSPSSRTPASRTAPAPTSSSSTDLVVPGADNLGGCAALESIVRRHALVGGLYAAICAAPPLALARWGMLNLNGVKARGNCASGVREQVPGGDGRRGRERGGRRQSRHGDTSTARTCS